MEQIIGKLSEIETTAEIIMKDALQKKKALSAEMERQSKEFDTQLEKQTEEQIRKFAGILRVRRISACHPCGKTLRLP